MKRQRGRGRKGGGGGQHQSNRALESNGPDVKVRGAAVTIYEKYQQLARDASSSGDRVKAENYLQHAEHYFRIMRAQEESRQAHDQQRQREQNPNQGGGQPQGGQGQHRPREAAGDEGEDRGDRGDRGQPRGEHRGNGRGESSGGPLEMVTPEESDLTEAAGEKKPRRGRKPRSEAAEDAA